MDVYQLFLMLIEYFIPYGKGNVSPITTYLKLIGSVTAIIQLNNSNSEPIYKKSLLDDMQALTHLIADKL